MFVASIYFLVHQSTWEKRSTREKKKKKKKKKGKTLISLGAILFSF